MIVFLFVILLSILCFDCLSSQITSKTLDNDELIDFFNSLGYSVEEQHSNKSIVIPSKFSSVFENYNKIQLAAGYDLKVYSGKKAELFSYRILDGNGQPTNYNANIIVYENTIIGGDISSVNFDGKMFPLIEKVKNENSKT